MSGGSAEISLIGLGSVTGFNQSMESTAIPEPSTWAMLLIGFGFMAWGAANRKTVRDILA